MNHTFLLSVATAVLLVLPSCETTSTADSSSAGAATGTPTEVKPYPLATCLVTGEGLESKGGSITQVYEGQEVKFCCKPCQYSFKKDPELFLAKIQ